MRRWWRSWLVGYHAKEEGEEGDNARDIMEWTLMDVGNSVDVWGKKKKKNDLKQMSCGFWFLVIKNPNKEGF